MSKGHGKWERAILQALKEAPAYYLTDLLPTPHTRSQVVALNRAANNLLTAGKIEISIWMTAYSGVGEHPHGFKTVFRPGSPNPTRQQITRLKRCTSFRSEPVQHLNHQFSLRRKEGLT